MKKILLILVFIIPALTFSQVKKSNFELIEKVKSQKSGKEIKKLLVGKWEFEKLTDKNGKTISIVNHNVTESIQAVEEVYRPSIKINETGNYELFNCEKTQCEKGIWKYDSSEKILLLTFDKPKYNVDIKKLAPGLLEQLKKSGTLREIKENFMEIAKINKTELIIIEHLPHNEFEFKYNLRVYKKK